MPTPPDSDEEPSLLLNVFQSELRSLPFAVAEAPGRLNVNVLLVPVIVKSEPVVDDAMVIAGPLCVCPIGPMVVIAAVR